MVSGVTVSRDTPAASLPENGRDVHALFPLLPGATITPASLSGGGQFTVGGQRPNANSFRVDGVSANVGIGIVSVPGSFPAGNLPGMTTVGGTETLAAKDETERVELRLADFAAEYGDRPGAQIAIETRSGSNDFHGSAFGFIRPQTLDSTDWFARGAGFPLAAASLNGWGASAGGPVWRNHTYFFASYQRTDVHDSALQAIPVANEALREQPGPYQAIFDAFPAPSGRALTSNESLGYSALRKVADANNVAMRVDQTIGSHIQLFGRFAYVPSASTSSELGAQYSASTWASGTGGFNVAGGRFTDEFRFNVSRATASAYNLSSDTPALSSVVQAVTTSTLNQYGFPITNPPFTSIGQLSVGGLGQTIAGQSFSDSQHQWTFTDIFTRHGAKQDIRIGAEYSDLKAGEQPLNRSVAIAAEGIEALLAGVPLGFTAAFTSLTGRNIQHASAFVQDSLHLSRDLDLLLGVRWELTISPFTAGTINNSVSYNLLGIWPGVGAPSTIVSDFAPETGSKWPRSYTQFAPRIGVAYHLRGPDLILRAGAGIFYDSQMGSIIGNESALNIWQYAPNAVNPSSILPSIAPWVQPSLSLPRVLEWRTSLEKSIGKEGTVSLSYAGSAGQHLLRNDATSDPGTGVLRSLAFTSNGKSSYEALLAQYRGNITSRLYSVVSYTWSHSIDIGSSDTAAFLVRPGESEANERGSSTFDVRQVLTAALGYRFNNRGNALLRNWNLSSTLMGRAGFPFDVTSVDRSVDLGFDNSGRANLVAGQPIWISDSSLPGGRALNPAAFTVATSGQNGNLGRDVLNGPGLFQIDVSLARSFRLFEKIQTEASVSAFNVLNRPAFANPVSYLGSALFGQSTSMGSGSPTTGLTPIYQAGGPRTIELGLRFTF